MQFAIISLHLFGQIDDRRDSIRRVFGGSGLDCLHHAIGGIQCFTRGPQIFVVARNRVALAVKPRLFDVFGQMSRRNLGFRDCQSGIAHIERDQTRNCRGKHYHEDCRQICRGQGAKLARDRHVVEERADPPEQGLAL